MEYNSLLLKCGLDVVNTLPKSTVWEKGKSYFTLEKTNKHYFIQMIKFDINSYVILIIYTYYIYICIDLM